MEIPVGLNQDRQFHYKYRPPFPPNHFNIIPLSLSPPPSLRSSRDFPHGFRAGRSGYGGGGDSSFEEERFLLWRRSRKRRGIGRGSGCVSSDREGDSLPRRPEAAVGAICGGDSRSVEENTEMAWNLRHGRGSRKSLRRSGEEPPWSESEDELRIIHHCSIRGCGRNCRSSAGDGSYSVPAFCDGRSGDVHTAAAASASSGEWEF